MIEFLIAMLIIASIIAVMIISFNRGVNGAWPWPPPPLPPGYRVVIDTPYSSGHATLYAPDGEKITYEFYEIWGWSGTNWKLYRTAMNHYRYKMQEEWNATHDDPRRGR